MDVITSLSHDELRVLESFVRTCGDEGVTERQFVEAVSRIMTRQGKEAEDREGLILRLSEVFSHVDVNRNGKIKWDDFTSHCVDIGISLRVKDSSKMKYVQNTNLIDRSNHGGRVNRMRYYDGRFDCVVTCESGEKSVKVYRLHNNSKLSLLGAFEVLTEEARKSKQRPRTIDAVMIPETSLLVTSTSDMMLCFWDISQVFRTSDDDNVMPRARFLASRRCHRVQYHLAYNTETSTLYSSGPSGDVHVWGLQYNPTKPFALTQKMKLERHDGMVTDILVVPEHDVVVTCGLDKNVFVWDSRDHHFKGSRKGHKMGVRTLCYAGGGCILSAGFDFNIFAWDISGVSQAPLFVLGGGFEGHRSSVINVMADLKSQCAFSVDEEGTIRWWDVRLDFSIVDSERALQVITADASFRQNMPFKPVSSCLIPGLSKVTYPILLYGDNTISMFNPVILDPAPEIPTCMSFSSKQMMLALVLGHDVKLFSLVDGSLSHDFKDVGRKANQIRFDANETKFVLSYENGEMRAYSTETGRHLSSTDVSCKKELTSMISDGKTHTIVTTSCDGSISVYDMLENKKKITRMRIVRECGDITCSAFSRDSNMIATGDAKRQIRLWNYATMNTEKDRLPRLENHVTSLAFVDPYPLLLSSDVSGRIFVWNIRTKKCVGVLNLLHNSTTSSSKFSGASIVDMRVVFEQKGGSEICPGIQTGAHLLVVSDSRGFITVLTLNSIIKALNVRVVSSEITTRSRYRVDRFDDRLFEEDQRENLRHQNVKKLDIKIISKWRAHDDMVKQMCVLSDPKCVVTLSSKSKNIKIWSLGHTSSMCGLILGELDTVHNHVVSKKWSVPVRHSERRALKMRRAQNLIEEIESSQKDDILEHTLKHLEDEDTFASNYDLIRVKRAMERNKDDLSNPRSRLQLQLIGARNWNMTSAELGRISSLAKTNETRKRAMSEEKMRWQKIVENASEETKRVIEFAELLEGTQLGMSNRNDDDDDDDGDDTFIVLSSSKSRRRRKRDSTVAEDKNDWSMGSTNRRKQMYPNMHVEEERNRVGCAGRGCSTRKLELTSSQFLDARIDDDFYVQSKWRPSTRVRRVLDQSIMMTSTMSARNSLNETSSGDGDEEDKKEDKGLPKDPNDWDTKAVCRFLNRNGLGKFLKYFSDAKIDGPGLLRLKPIDMDEFGMNRSEAAEFIQLTGSLKMM